MGLSMKTGEAPYQGSPTTSLCSNLPKMLTLPPTLRHAFLHLVLTTLARTEEFMVGEAQRPVLKQLPVFCLRSRFPLFPIPFAKPPLATPSPDPTLMASASPALPATVASSQAKWCVPVLLGKTLARATVEDRS